MDLMEFASPPAPQMEACDVGQLLLEAKNTFLGSDHPQAKSSRVDIETGQGLPPAWVDRSQIRAAIVELVSNAATASDPGKPVGLAAAMDEVNNVLLITVSDSGKGMDQRVLDHAFTPFFSLQKAGRRRGMGLPRVKRYVESNGGRIWISSRPSEGTTVYVQLPTEAGGR
jgi:signal transduction histidine kinase